MNQKIKRAELLPCPFCGAGKTEVRENGRPWLGTRGWGEPVSVSVRHWCEPVDGQPSRMIERVGRDRAAAIAAWNRRAGEVPSEQATPEEIAALKNDLREYMLAANAEASEVDRLNRHLQEALAHLRTIASFGGTVEQARKLAMAGLDRAGTPTPAQSNPEPRLYQHTDGRYGLSFGPAKFAQGEPAWYAVPIDVYEDEGR